MMVFFIGAVALVVLALVFVLWPLWQSMNVTSAADLRESTNVSLYRDHLSDIEKSLQSGAITQAQYEQLKIELERNLLEDSQSSVMDAASSTSKGRNAYLIGGLAVVVIVAAGFIYAQLGAYEAWQVKTVLDQRTVLEKQYIATGDPELQSQITALNKTVITRLVEHVKKSPEDLQMRVLLARTAMTAGDYSLAIEHFQGALAQEPELTQVMSELAQAVFLKAGNKVVPIVQALVEQVLVREPNNTIALGLAGIGAFQSEQYPEAISIWRQAIVLQGANSPNSIALQRGISAAQQRLGLDPSEIESASSSVANAPAESSDSNKVVNPTITVSVVLAEGIDVAPETTVFIYARAWQGAKVPLSIARLQASQLPTTLTLTNAMSMAPGMDLSSAQAVELVARISNSGTPVPQPGDWQVTLGPVEVTENNTQPYTLLIADQVQ
jgi:cytochrome c-type biogenesis protein CcmH